MPTNVIWEPNIDNEWERHYWDTARESTANADSTTATEVMLAHQSSLRRAAVEAEAEARRLADITGLYRGVLYDTVVNFPNGSQVHFSNKTKKTQGAYDYLKPLIEII